MRATIVQVAVAVDRLARWDLLGKQLIMVLRHFSVAFALWMGLGKLVRSGLVQTPIFPQDSFLVVAICSRCSALG